MTFFVPFSGFRLISNYKTDKQSMARHVPYKVWDGNCYWAEAANVTFSGGASSGKESWQKAGLDRHSLFDVDPLLRNADRRQSADWPFGIHLDDKSPALGVGGFHNFDYGPRNRH